MHRMDFRLKLKLSEMFSQKKDAEFHLNGSTDEKLNSLDANEIKVIYIT